MHVFMSHSSKDADVAMEYVEALEASGLRAWVAPRDLSPGTDYAHTISEAIGNASAFLLLCSRASLASLDVRNEFELAKRRGTRVIPIRLAGSPDPLDDAAWEYHLLRLQIVSGGVPRETVERLMSSLSATSAQPDLTTAGAGSDLSLTTRPAGDAASNGAERLQNVWDKATRIISRAFNNPRLPPRQKLPGGGFLRWVYLESNEGPYVSVECVPSNMGTDHPALSFVVSKETPEYVTIRDALLRSRHGNDVSQDDRGVHVALPYSAHSGTDDAIEALVAAVTGLRNVALGRTDHGSSVGVSRVKVTDRDGDTNEVAAASSLSRAQSGACAPKASRTIKVLCWNMGAAFGFKGEKHVSAWEWLNAQDADVAMLQEVVPRPEHLGDWESVVFAAKWQDWGSAVLIRDGGYEHWNPTDQHPWLQTVRGAVAVAKPVDGTGPWFASVHSDASSFEATARKYKNTYQNLPADDGILRSRKAETWEIEVIAHELKPLLADKRFIFGGDLNSSLLFDKPGRSEEAKLFENLATLGYTDIRPRHSPEEVQTYFKPRSRPFMLDHVFADAVTESTVQSWRVLKEVAAELGLSDHAPIEIVVET